MKVFLNGGPKHGHVIDWNSTTDRIEFAELPTLQFIPVQVLTPEAISKEPPRHLYLRSVVSSNQFVYQP